MTFATEMPRIDLRRARANSLASAIFLKMQPYLRTEGPDERHVLRDAFDELFKLLYEEGVEVFTDFDRAKLGLSPRGFDGWTAEEIIALERARIEAFQNPKPFIVNKETTN